MFHWRSLWHPSPHQSGPRTPADTAWCPPPIAWSDGRHHLWPETAGSHMHWCGPMHQCWTQTKSYNLVDRRFSIWVLMSDVKPWYRWSLNDHSLEKFERVHRIKQCDNGHQDWEVNSALIQLTNRRETLVQHNLHVHVMNKQTVSRFEYSVHDAEAVWAAQGPQWQLLCQYPACGKQKVQYISHWNRECPCSSGGCIASSLLSSICILFCILPITLTTMQ